MDNQAFAQLQGRWIFVLGRENVAAARVTAAQCPWFAEDDEDEQVDDVLRSCHNCAYRRWTTASFECLALKSSSHQE